MSNIINSSSKSVKREDGIIVELEKKDRGELIVQMNNGNVAIVEYSGSYDIAPNESHILTVTEYPPTSNLKPNASPAVTKIINQYF